MYRIVFMISGEECVIYADNTDELSEILETIFLNGNNGIEYMKIEESE